MFNWKGNHKIPSHPLYIQVPIVIKKNHERPQKNLQRLVIPKSRVNPRHSRTKRVIAKEQDNQFTPPANSHPINIQKDHKTSKAPL
jgi:hypothetical protein